MMSPDASEAVRPPSATACHAGGLWTEMTGHNAGLEAQERDLRAAGCNKLFIEQVSSGGNRQQLEAALG